MITNTFCLKVIVSGFFKKERNKKMSSGPTFVGGDEKECKKRDFYLNVTFTVEDWCTYEGECLYDDLVSNHNVICLFCKHRKPLDIPEILIHRKLEIEKQRQEEKEKEEKEKLQSVPEEK
jgi:hypothetical protein